MDTLAISRQPHNSPNLLPRYLSMFRPPAIFGPLGWSTSKTGTCPKGISAIMQQNTAQFKDHAHNQVLTGLVFILPLVYLKSKVPVLHVSLRKDDSNHFSASSCIKVVKFVKVRHDLQPGYFLFDFKKL